MQFALHPGLEPTRSRGFFPRLLIAALLLLLAASAFALQPSERDLKPGLQIPAAAAVGPAFDVDAATEAYLGLLSPEQRRLSDRYFEGGYWVQLWEVLWTVGSCALLLVTGVSRRIGDWSRRISARRWVSVPLCIVVLLFSLTVLQIPLSVYVDFVREHQYGLSEQSFAGWASDQAIVLGVDILVGAIVLTLIYAAVRRSGAHWWVWATGLSFVFLLIAQLVAPVYFLPLLNDYRPLPEGPVRTAVLSLARANGVPTHHVEWFDASKQTTRVSANVAGLLGTTRIALNDNLLNKTSMPEIKAVLGHEMGHYVLNHGWKLPIMFTLLIGLAMWLLGVGVDRTLSRFGARFGLGARTDPASLPVAIALFSIIFSLMTPLQNLVVRTCEQEADAFGLNAAREPYGAAMVAMRLSTYRKLRPGAFEEFLFYDHPSGYERVHEAMVWLRENQALVTAADVTHSNQH
jgi:STE24 endopeptidase